MPPQHTPERFALETRKLQILQSEFNSVLRWQLWGMQVTLIAAAVFGLCGAVWNEEPGRKVHLATSGCASVVFLAFIYTRLASIFDNSSDTLKQWRGCGSRQQAWLSRFLRSTPSLRVLIGAYFYADKQLVLTSVGIVIENTVTLLVGRRG